MYLSLLWCVFFIFSTFEAKNVSTVIKLQVKRKEQGTSDCECGIADWNPKKPIEGRNTTTHKHPWMVSIFRNETTKICGGTLISPKFIITAAHCFARGKKRRVIKDNENMCIINGERGPCYRSADEFKVALFGLDDNLKVRIPAKSIIGHPTFHNSSPEYDIALVELEHAIQCGKFIRPICLPWSIPELEAKANAESAGWGGQVTKKDKIENSKKKNLPVLFEANLQVQSQEVCKKFYKNRKEITTICAKGNGNVIRSGDSGGPLTVKVKGKMYIIGVISFSARKGESKPAFFFSKVKYFQSWIKKIIKEY